MRSGAPHNLKENRMNLYRLLLHLYPSTFRAEYGDEMSAIFALELDHRRGLPARVALQQLTS